jgi:hypothetical protein
MKTYIEIWKAKEAWHNMPKVQRGEYMGQLGPAIQGLLESGVKIISWGINNKKTFKRANYDFFGVWEFPNQESIESFEKLVESAGWYTYFEQVNLCGATTTPEEVIGKMIAL